MATNITRYQECACNPQNTDPYSLEFKYSFDKLSLVDLSSCLLVCRRWDNWARPLWTSRIQRNLERVEFIPPTRLTYSQIKIRLTAAKAAACVDSKRALSLLSSAKEMAMQWDPQKDIRHEIRDMNMEAIEKGLLSSKQEVIDAFIQIVELESRIDRNRAIQSLTEFKMFAEKLSELDKSYAYFKIAQLEVNIGIEKADIALSLAKANFLWVTGKVKMEIHRTRIGSGLGTDCLISLAWLQAPICLTQADYTLRFTLVKHSLDRHAFYARMRYIILFLKGPATLNLQQQDIFTQLSKRFRQRYGIQEDEPAKPLFQYTMKINSVEAPLDVALGLIASARLRASSDSAAAWDILKNVLDLVPTIECSDKSHFSFESPTYVVMRLVQETLRI